MKRILSVALWLSVTLPGITQLAGDGSYGNPWSGTLAGDATWSGTKYVNGDITVDNEKLTISAGANIIFLAENTDLIITGTGILEASGTSASRITFTADDDNDGNYGESGENWGHIFFNLPSESNQSVINWCTIEYGDVHLFSDSRGYGGAIYANLTNLLISNSIIRNNYGEWGGGVFVGAGRSPILRNCLIYNNRSDHGGGGVYCWNTSGSLIENCIFDSNQSLEPSVTYYTGGGLAAQTNCSVKIVNCTFVNNTSARVEGKAILFHSSPNSRIINTIAWGADQKQIYLYGTSPITLINSAYRGYTTNLTGNPVNPVVLNASNSASDGPNFVATDGSDWSLLFISPCLDKGTNSYTGVTIPATDYNGNPRISTKDIGAFETQYSRWAGTTSTVWSTSSNWEGSVLPTSGTGDVVIPANLTNYPVGDAAQNFTINASRRMIVEPGARVTLNSLTNNGILRMNATSTGIYSLIINSYSRGGGGSEEIQMFATGGGSQLPNDYKWHYISSPVNSLSTDVFTAATLDLAQFIESRVAASLLQGWVAYDGYVYSTGQMNGPTFNTLTPGKGYNFWDGVDNTFTFGGLLNTSDVTMPLPFKGVPSMHGFNLLGNPFTSGLDWNIIIAGTFPANTSKGLYFTRNNTQCSFIGGVGVPSDVNGIIPPGQGFFTKTYSTGNSITLPLTARTHTNIHLPYKGAEDIPLIRLAVKKDTVLFDETVIRFDDLAKTGLDNDFDAIKLFPSSERVYVCSVTEGADFAINGLPYPSTFYEIPLTVNIIEDGSYKLSATQLQNLNGYNLLLYDKLTGWFINTKNNPTLSFFADSGKYTDRFILKVTSIATGEEETGLEEKSFKIYSAGKIIRIETLSDTWNGIAGAVKIYDITGKMVSINPEVNFSKDSPTDIRESFSAGVYIVEVGSGTLRHTEKVIIR